MKNEASPAKSASMGWVPVVGLAWLIPGGGHFLLRHTWRGVILLSAVLVSFVVGLLCRGALFSPQTGDLFTTLIYCGGFAGNLASGIFYLLTVWMGYAQQDVAGHVYDYGTKFLVAAGLLNILAMVDAYELAVGKKQ